MILKPFIIILISFILATGFSLPALAADCGYLTGNGLTDSYNTVRYNADFGDVDYTVMMKRTTADVVTDANSIFIRGTVSPLGDKQRWYSYYGFFYSRNGYFSIWKRVNGGPPEALLLDPTGWQFDSIINQFDSWNKLRVVASGTSLSFYINDKLVWSGTDSSLTSGRVGLGMFSSQGPATNELLVDYATLVGGFDSQFDCSAQGWEKNFGIWNLFYDLYLPLIQKN